MNKRLGWIDIARGIGIILVVLGHTLPKVIRENHLWAMNMYDFIYFFHMNLMFFISGIAFNISAGKYKNSKNGDYVGKKVKKLLVPYISYSFLIFLCFTIANSFSGLERILTNAGYGKISFLAWLKELITAENNYCLHLWYIYALFIFSIIAYFLLKVFGEKYRYVLLGIAFVFWLSLYYEGHPDIIIYWTSSLQGIWFALGTFVDKDFYFDKNKKLVAFIGLPILLGIKFILDYVGVPETISRLIKIVIVLGIIMFMIALSQLMEEKGEKIFSWFGKKSFPIYLFHQPFFGSGLGVVLYGQLHINAAICVIISFCFCIIVPLIVEKILDIKYLSFIKKILLG